MSTTQGDAQADDEIYPTSYIFIKTFYFNLYSVLLLIEFAIFLSINSRQHL